MKKPCLISCKEATKLMSLSFERKLTLKEKIALNAHLLVCKTCVLCFRQVKGLRKLFHRYDDTICHLPPSKEAMLSTKAKERIKSSLKENS